MTWLVIQLAFLIALSYALGCFIGYFARRALADPESPPGPALQETANAVSAAAVPLAETSVEPSSPEPAQDSNVASEEMAEVAVVQSEEAAASKADTVGSRPKVLKEPLDGKPDNLKIIKGIGPVIEGKLNALGIYHIWQIADWGAEEVAWVENFLYFPGRIEREEWIRQARQITNADS
ncbi:MAG: hypothetical protein AAGE61_01320 [Pseudomonadota bacterium]